MAKFALMALAAALAASGPSWAKDIPVEIRWQGTKPTTVSKTVPGGFRPLTHDAQSDSFKGTVEIDGDVPQRRTFIVNYGGYNHPIDVRVHRFLKDIEFTVSLQPATSCTERRVLLAGKQANSVPDALQGIASAGQLLNIASPNDCDKNLAWNAKRTRYRQNVRLMQLSSGFFLISPQFAEDYQHSAQLRNIDVAGEVQDYARQEAGLEAVLLRVARQDAQENRDFGLAASISEAMYMRTESDTEAREAYAGEGLRSETLLQDTQWLQTLAEAQAEVSVER